MRNTPISSQLRALVAKGALRPIDQMLGDFVAQQEGKEKSLAGMLAAYLSARLGQQDTCVAWDQLEQGFGPEYLFPCGEALLQGLQNADMVMKTTQDTQADLPLVFDEGNLYLQRYWQYEKHLSSNLLARAQKKKALPEPLMSEYLGQLFPQSTDEVDWQKVAVCVSAMNYLTIITGGPGTGKTTTVAKLLALLQGINSRQGKPLKIELVAPTGKAAARLSESMAQARTRLPEALQANLPEQCSTIHRLLKSIPNSQSFRFNRHNPLHLDVLVVDEASMVDLPLMSKLFDAIPMHAQVIMLGDKEQLASVEAGSVLSDICQAALGGNKVPDYSLTVVDFLSNVADIQFSVPQGVNQSISDNLVNLQKSHRFSAHSGVGKLAAAINSGLVRESFALFWDLEFEDIHWHPDKQQSQLVQQLLPIYKQYIAAVQQGDLATAFGCLSQQQVLCAQKNGKWGVFELNQMIEAELAYQGLIDMSREHYSGRPVMLSENDHVMKLFNGDIGVVMPDTDNRDVMKVWFVEPDGQFRGVLPNRLPPHDTVFAMTIHKSQGSEFANVHLCLPEKQSASLIRGLSRELLYTGLTRAKQSFALYGQKEVITHCINTRCKRSSGLAGRLV